MPDKPMSEAAAELLGSTALVAAGGIAVPAGLFPGFQGSPILDALPRMTARRDGVLLYPTPGLGPLTGEAAEAWERKREQDRRVAAREHTIKTNFCSCRHVNVGWDDDYEAEWVRGRGNCEVHGWSDGPEWRD